MKINFKIVFFAILLSLFGFILFHRYQENKIQTPVSTTSIIPTNTLTPTVTTTPSPTLPPVSPTVMTSRASRIYVGPDGNDRNNGRSRDTALKTIQNAIKRAQPGYIVELLPGEYYQDIVTERDGLPNLPITISGSRRAILKGAKNARIFEINHSYIVLDGFTIEGQHDRSNDKSSYRDKLIYVIGKQPKSGPTNIKIINMEIKNAGGECIRFRYFAQHNEVAYNQIFRCGVIDFEFGGGGKNGEAIYIGTAPEQRKDGKNPTKDVDQSNNNWIHHNTINTNGNECVDIKEDSSLNIVEYNSCTGQKDTESGGMDSRGENNIFRYNIIFNNEGAGVRLGGDEENDGINNQVYDNTISDNKSGGIKFQRTPQGKVCENNMKNNQGGNSVGSYGEEFEPEKSCSL